MGYTPTIRALGELLLTGDEAEPPLYGSRKKAIRPEAGVYPTAEPRGSSHNTCHECCVTDHGTDSSIIYWDVGLANLLRSQSREAARFQTTEIVARFRSDLDALPTLNLR